MVYDNSAREQLREGDSEPRPWPSGGRGLRVTAAISPGAVPLDPAVAERRCFATGFQEETVKGLRLRIIHAYLGCASLIALIVVGGAGSHWN